MAKQVKSTQLAIRFNDKQIERLEILAEALGSDNLSGAVRWAVQNAPSPSATQTKRDRRSVAKQMEIAEAIG